MEENTYIVRQTTPIIPCIVCGKLDTDGYCSDTCRDIDQGGMKVVTIGEMLEAEE